MARLINSAVSAYYGWYVVAALFFITFLGVGSRQGFGVFMKAWEDDFGTSVSLISTAAAVGWLTNGVAQPLFGALTDRFGGRPVVIASLIVMGIGVAAMSLISNVFMLIAVYGFVISFASGGASFTTTGTIVARWFRRRRGAAISFLISGASLGGLLLVPFAAYLMILSSWQVAWAVMGGMILFLGVPVVAFIVRSSPGRPGIRRRISQSGPSEDSGDSGQPEGPLATASWRESFSSGPMWQLSMGYFVCGITTASISVHYVRWAQDQDISPGTAALAFGLLSGINGIGVLAVGWLSDRMQRKTLLGTVYLVRAAAFLTLIVLPPGAALWAFALIGGASWLATVPLTTSLTADVYGLRALGTLSGLINMAHQLGGAGAVIVFGVVFDAFGSYDPAFAGAFVTLILAGVVSLSIRERRYSSRYAGHVRAFVPTPARAE